MELLEVIRARHSVRAYQNRAVEREKLKSLLTAASQAPSAGNLQAYRVHVVSDEPTKQALAAAAQGQGFVAQAPVVLAFCADLARAGNLGRQREQNYSPQDAIIAMAYAQLAATEQGLASCWVGAFDERQVARALGLPDRERPVALLPLGYAAETPPAVPRRPLAELVTGW